MGDVGEVIDNDGQSALINHDEQTNLTNPTSNTLELPTKSSVRVKPLAEKQVTNILTVVCGAYSSFSEEQQFEISSLVLKLQEVVCLNKSRNDVVFDDNRGMILEVPNSLARMTQRKKRAQPRHEIQANTASKKIQKSLQNIGLLHDVSNDSCSIQVNCKLSRIVHCKFCFLGHIVTNCPHHDELKLKAYEYQLSTSSEEDMDHLRQRVRNTHIPKIDVVPHQSQIFGVIPANLQSKNFIIHRAQDIGTTSFDVI